MDIFILAPIALLLHNDGGAPAIGSPEHMHAEMWDTALRRKNDREHY